MALYLISYDLLKPGQNYEVLTDVLKKQGAKKALSSAWALRAASPATEIRDWVRNFSDASDRIVVTELHNWASWNAMIDINEV